MILRRDRGSCSEPQFGLHGGHRRKGSEPGCRETGDQGIMAKTSRQEVFGAVQRVPRVIRWGLMGAFLVFNLLSCSKYVLVPDVKCETLLGKGIFYSDIRDIEVQRDSGRVTYKLRVR